MAKISKGSSVVVGAGKNPSKSVFYKVRLPDGKSTKVMNKRVYKNSLNAADVKVREYTKRRPGAA